MHKSRQPLFYFYSIPLLIVLFSIVVYAPSFIAPFQFDDTLTILENSATKNLGDIKSIWLFDPSRFLTHLSFALNYHFSGLDIFGYHWVNFIIHLMVGFVVYLTLRYVILAGQDDRTPIHLQSLCIFATSIFLFHPLQTQAVTYISQRSTLLAALFYLLTVFFYCQFRIKNHYAYYGISLITATLGVFTKPIIITLPLILILCEIYFFNALKTSRRRIIFNCIPYFLIVMAVPALLILWKYKTFDLSRVFDITHETTKITRGEYALTEVNVLVTYLRLLILPIRQNLDYDYPIANTFFAIPTFLSFLFLVLLMGVAVRIFKTCKLISFSIFWYFLTLSLESSIFPISDVIFEHRLYLPMVGFSLALTMALKDFLKGWRSYIIVACIVVSLLSLLSYRRNQVWSDKIGFLLDVVAKSPNKARVHNNLANAYYNIREFTKAETEYKKAIALDSHYAHPHNNLASIYMNRKQLDSAKKELEKALAISPNYEAAFYNLGNLDYQIGKFKDAKENYHKAVALKTTFFPAYYGLGNVALLENDLGQAKNYFVQAITLNSDYAYGYYGLGQVYRNLANYDLALQEYEKALTKDSTILSCYNDIGNILDIKGQYQEAIHYYRKALALEPRYANAYFNLAGAYKKIGRRQDARDCLYMALKFYKEEGNLPMQIKTKERLQQIEQ